MLVDRNWGRIYAAMAVLLLTFLTEVRAQSDVARPDALGAPQVIRVSDSLSEVAVSSLEEQLDALRSEISRLRDSSSKPKFPSKTERKEACLADYVKFNGEHLRTQTGSG